MARNIVADIAGLAFWVLLTFGVALVASQYEPGPWYQTIAKPGWTPPGWVFGPVWGVLYLAMSISAWMIWRQRSGGNVVLPLLLYVAQLLVNGMWSWLFFGRQMIGLALVDLFLLVLLVAFTLIIFIRLNRWAGVLLIPYMAWISFALALNFQIWRLN